MRRLASREDSGTGDARRCAADNAGIPGAGDRRGVGGPVERGWPHRLPGGAASAAGGGCLLAARGLDAAGTCHRTAGGAAAKLCRVWGEDEVGRGQARAPVGRTIWAVHAGASVLHMSVLWGWLCACRCCVGYWVRLAGPRPDGGDGCGRCPRLLRRDPSERVAPSAGHHR